MNRNLCCVAWLCLAFVVLPRESRAETYSTCTGFVDAAPAVITSQGTWCLRRDLATGVTTGAAIRINVNNVTIDCNGFKIGGLAAGITSQAYGVHAQERQNVTVRNCSLRGFMQGINITGGAGHLVEDNRLDNNLVAGAYVAGDNSMVRRNLVYDTGGRVGTNHAWGLYGLAHFVDNVVSGVFAVAPGQRTGINAMQVGSLIRGNQITGLVVPVGGIGYGIVAADRSRVEGNHVVNALTVEGSGLAGASGAFCLGNTVAGFTTNIQPCVDGGGNMVPVP